MQSALTIADGVVEVGRRFLDRRRLGGRSEEANKIGGIRVERAPLPLCERDEGLLQLDLPARRLQSATA